MKAYHQRAKKQQSYYEQLTGERSKYSEFLKTETPLNRKVVVYDVSYQLNYASNKSSLFINSPETYRVYAIENENTSDIIYQNTKDAVINMKSINGNGFQLETQKMINDKIKIDISKRSPRGLERTDNYKLNEDIIKKIKSSNNGLYVETVDSLVKVKGGKKDKVTRQTEMKTDMTLYFK